MLTVPKPLLTNTIRRIVLPVFGISPSRGRRQPTPFLLLVLFAAGCQDAPAVQSAAPAAQWDHVRTWSGKGSQYLDSFPSEGALKVEWEAKRASDAKGEGTLKITLHSAISGRPLAAPIVDHRGEGKGVAYFSEEPRVFFASVNSDDLDWKVSISERVR